MEPEYHRVVEEIVVPALSGDVYVNSYRRCAGLCAARGLPHHEEVPSHGTGASALTSAAQGEAQRLGRVYRGSQVA